MPPKANELFARKDMDFLLILEKKTTTTTTTTNSEEKRKKTKTRKPKIAQTNQWYSKETRTPGLEQKTQLRETKTC